MTDIEDRPDGSSGAALADLLASPRLSERLRDELLRRARADDPAGPPRSMSERQIEALRALVRRILPTVDGMGIDLAPRLDAMMAEAAGNGWRYEALPADPEAYRVGLDTLDALARDLGAARFAGLAGDEQDALLARVQAGEAGVGPGGAALFDAGQMALWFEEARSDAARLYAAHPAVIARIGYGGVLNGRESGPAFPGFRALGIGEREAFEPRLPAEAAR